MVGTEHRKKLGTLVVDEVRSAGKAASAQFVVVNVHRINPDARAFYDALGFTVVEGSGEPDSYEMKLLLNLTE